MPRLLFCIALILTLSGLSAEAGRRGSFHADVRVWHGNRVGHWSQGQWSRGWNRNPGWHNPGWNRGWNPRWNSVWAWSKAHGYPHRWWSWNSRRHFAARRHARQAFRHWDRGWHGARWNHQRQRQGTWYASPGFGSTNARAGGPERQGVWYSD